jgi:ABC-type multidrug transport system ATPase subunit
MHIQLENLGKRYNRQWIFRRINFSFSSGNAYAIVGPNGSGKSTLLQVIAGATEKTEGNISYNFGSTPVAVENHFKHLSVAAPYLELVEELTLREFLDFHFSFKPLPADVTIPFIIEYLGLKAASNKQIRYFSSGMKQRVKLAQAVFNNLPVVLLDEPTANLDLDGVALYHRMVADYCRDRLLLIGSNDEAEISMCRERLNVNEFKAF